MPDVSFAKVVVDSSYSRNDLAQLWGYADYHAIARGVVTPKDDNKIILFVTQQKQTTATQYEDDLAGKTVRWEGPSDHFAEDRMLQADKTGDEIHLFYRERHHTDFTYIGRLKLVSCERQTKDPSKFVFRVV